MKDYVVLSSEYGSAVRLVGKHLKEVCGFNFYNEEDILQKTAELSDFDADTLHAYDNYLGKIYFDAEKAAEIAKNFPEDMPKKVFDAYHKTIDKIISEGPCLLMERGADIFLRGKVDFLNVFVYTIDMQKKIDRGITIGKMKPEEVVQNILEADMQRKNFHNMFSNVEWGNRKSYDVCLNSDVLGIETCALIVENLVKIL